MAASLEQGDTAAGSPPVFLWDLYILSYQAHGSATTPLETVNYYLHSFIFFKENRHKNILNTALKNSTEKTSLIELVYNFIMMLFLCNKSTL